MQGVNECSTKSLFARGVATFAVQTNEDHGGLPHYHLPQNPSTDAPCCGRGQVRREWMRLRFQMLDRRAYGESIDMMDSR
jgi:hypothetical protein